MDRPIIGITTSLTPDARGALEQRLDHAYVRAVEAAGGLPVLAPMLATDEAMDDFASLIDGLIVSGGPAVTRGMIGDQPDDLGETEPIRADTDARLLGTFLDARRPVLGICYGMQLASALRGGTIWADAERDRPDTGVHSAARLGPDHDVFAVPSSHVRRIVGTDRLHVGTRHVQAIHALGDGFLVSATAPDGVVEAIETRDGTFIGVQFHPEALGAPFDGLFSDLVERARTARAARFLRSDGSNDSSAAYDTPVP